MLIKRGRTPEPEVVEAASNGRGPSVLLVSLAETTRQGLATGEPVHLRVPVGEGIIDLVIVASDTEPDELPPYIAALFRAATMVVQVSDDDDGGLP